jgi:hypothetical protein
MFGWMRSFRGLRFSWIVAESFAGLEVGFLKRGKGENHRFLLVITPLPSQKIYVLLDSLSAIMVIANVARRVTSREVKTRS